MADWDGNSSRTCHAQTGEATARTVRKLPTPAGPTGAVDRTGRLDRAGGLDGARPPDGVRPPDGAGSLQTVLTMAMDSFDQFSSEVRDYTCVMVRRERVEGRLRPHEFIYAKVRHRRQEGEQVLVPLSIYLKFLKPDSVRGREVLYVEGADEGQMLTRRGGTRFAFVTTRVDPFGELAMRGNRYPITEFGIENLLYRLIETVRSNLTASCAVEFLPDAKIADRPALGIIVTHGSQEVSPDFYQARVFVDRELNLPVHFESYGWPPEPGLEPLLLEQYTYRKLQLNPGLTDADFSADNPQYQLK